MKLNSKSKIKRRPNPAWSIFNKINMTQFFLKTYVPFAISKCLLYNMDCTKFWKPRLTYIGNCFQLSPNDVIDVSAAKHQPHGVYIWRKPADCKQIIRFQRYFGCKILTKNGWIIGTPRIKIFKFLLSFQIEIWDEKLQRKPNLNKPLSAITDSGL